MTSTTMQPAGIYGRQSVGKRTSVEDQIRAGEDLCRQEDWPVHRVYSDLVSASRFGTKPRGDWAQLVADVSAGHLGVVVVWDPSRGDRTPESWFGFLSRCRENGVLIHSLRDQRTYDVRLPRDWRTLAEDGVTAAYESEVRSVDVRRGIAGAAVAGKPHGRPLFGFTRTYDPTDRKVFHDRPNEKAPIAAEIIERVSREDPLIAIVRDLNDRGVPAPGGGLWDRKNARRLATNPAYVGKRQHHGELHDAAWPAVVDDETFWRAQRVLTAPDRRTAPPGAARHLLSYLVSAHCGHLMQAAGQTGGRSPRYRCTDCGCVSIDLKAADTYITELVVRRLSRKDARRLFEAGNGAVKAARAEVARLEGLVEEARESFESGDGISATALARRERALEPQLEAARQRVTEHSRSAAVLTLIGDGQFTEETARPRWEALSVAARRSVVKALFERVEVAPSMRTLTRWHNDRDRLADASERITVKWRQPVT
jgi:site-specific DNA recombinase